MKANEIKLLDFLKKSPQFNIPIYQRTYSWTELECRQLWNDIIRAGKNEKILAHFIGSIVYIEEGLFTVATLSSLLVIDGQQRLATVSLIIEALARHLGEYNVIDGFSSKKLRSYYLLNPLEDDERYYKLILTQTDKQSLLALMSQRSLPSEHSIHIRENFEYFEKQLKELGDDMIDLWKGLAKLIIVDISLSRDQDNPQLIFESMNSTGRELSQADLIRNFVLMGLPPEQQNRLYDYHWRPMEVAFGQDAYGKQFDSFMRHYLTYKTGEIPNIKDVYEVFKAHARSPIIKNAGEVELVKDLQKYASYYCAMALDQEQNTQLKLAFRDLRELKVDVAFPLLLELYDDYSKGILTIEEFEQTVRLIESYVFRRAVCAIPTNSLNKTFATFGRALTKDHYLESILGHFLLLPSYRRFPGEDEFRREIKVRDLYNFRGRSFWLRRMENYGRKEKVPVDEYTIEHILPQNENLSQEWKNSLGPNWKEIQETWLNTIGNLTLTGYNSEYGDRSFLVKRDMKGGFAQSPLRVNEQLRNLESWNETTIETRAESLALKAIEIWKYPQLDAETLNAYSPKVVREEIYSINDHLYICKESETYNEKIYHLFHALRKEILSLNPCVTETFLKLYIAYKAETNFVDIVTQSKRLRLSLNMRFHELHDPKELARDITEIGRWGNGDVEIGLQEFEEIPYVMGLIRQSFEMQMGHSDENI